VLRKTTLAFLLGTVGVSYAASNSIDKVNNSARASFLIQYMYYKETSEKRGHEVTLDSNKGTMAGFDMMLSHQFGPIYANVTTKMISGNTPYSGATQQTHIPLKKNSAPTFLFDGYGILGYTFKLNKKMALIPYAELGYHSWERSTLSGLASNSSFVSAGQENYWNSYWAGGLRFEVQPADPLVVSLYGAVGRTFNAHLYNPKTASYPGSGVEAGSTYNLKSRPWYNAGLDFDFLAAEHVHLFARLEYTYFNYGKSPTKNREPGNPSNGSDEPDSLTRYLTAYLGVGYDFLTNHDDENYQTVSNSIAAFNNQASVAFMALYNDYKLSARNGAAEDKIRTGTDKGYIPGANISIAKTWHHVLFKAFSEYASGNVKYTSNSGNNVKTPSATINHYRANLGLGYVKYLNQNLALVPQFIFGFEHDNFMIKKTNNYVSQSNLYYFFYTGMGANLDWQVSKRWVLSPGLSGGITFSNTVFSPLSEVQFHPSNSTWYQASLEGDFAMTQEFHFYSQLAYRHVGFSQSSRTYATGSSLISAIMPRAYYNTVSASGGIAFEFSA